ncbi:restriction endonuclease subunit S [Pseudoalteromonas neustonica]|uniref:restriction endonuclease subunit S n=1 Tax=Pseudoalteromonas neustonica TaxID=1840331 RepID=UPI0007DAF061|nr:restriction endonuclease subunit S [Pseudoalteromonas neustonica]
MDANLLSLPKHWEIKTLVELTVQKNVSYGIVQPGKHENDGIPIIRVNNFTSSGLDVSNVMKVAPKLANKSLKTSLKKNDLLLTLVGSTGLTYIVPKEYEGWNVARAVAVIRGDNTVSAGWIKICLDSTFTKYFLDSRANTTVQKTLNLSDVKQVPIPIPLAHERAFIEKNIGNLNEKIELNQKTNQTLEQMAQALFKSWFVDFDPVFDNLLASVDFKLENLETSLPGELILKAQRRLAALNSLENAAECKASLSALAHELQAQLSTKEATQAAVQVSEKAAETPVKANFNANPHILAQHANTHAHFPNEFEHNEQLGWIPKGWEVLPLESLIILIGGGTPKTSVEEYWNGDIPWFSVVDAPQDSDVFVVDTEKHVTQLGVDKSSTKILRVGTTIISARGTVGKCAFVGTPMAMNQSCYGINGINNISDEFIYYLTRHQVSDLQKRGHGSVFNTITRETFKSILLPFSGDKLTKEFGKAVTSLFDKILMNNRQNAELIKLRDTLLPKLISGELQIPDVATDE